MMTVPMLALRCTPLAVVLLAGGCGQTQDVEETGATTAIRAPDARDLALLDAIVADAMASADSVEELLQPVPLLTPGQRASLQRASNDRQLARARALGTRVPDSTALRRLVDEGRLTALEDTTEYWVLRDLTHSLPYVTPDTRALLQEIGSRFQDELESMGLPRYRVEVTSVLRTPAAQAELRTSNVNAASGTSTHEFGTTLDLAYGGYTAPADLGQDLDLPNDPRMAALARRAAALALERAAARKSSELQKILGLVLGEMQDEGLLLVTLEEQQPVYHLTIARAASTDG